MEPYHNDITPFDREYLGWRAELGDLPPYYFYCDVLVAAVDILFSLKHTGNSFIFQFRCLAL